MAMRKLLISLISCIMVLSISSCGYEGRFRYECQDPEKWRTAECNPPICEPTGTCTKYIVENYEE